MSAGTSALFCCLVCFLIYTCSAQTIITAELGQEVFLPCKVHNINYIRVVEWRRHDQDPEYVLFYRDGHFDPHGQHPSYQNRVDLQDKEMKDGDVSLILKDVKMEDTGRYECRVFEKGKIEPISIINLEVVEPGNEDRSTGVAGDKDGLIGNGGDTAGISAGSLVSVMLWLLLVF